MFVKGKLRLRLVVRQLSELSETELVTLKLQQ